MAEYNINISKTSGDVLRVKITKESTGKSVMAYISGDELAVMLIEKSQLDLNLEPSEQLKQAFDGH